MICVLNGEYATILMPFFLHNARNLFAEEADGALTCNAKIALLHAVIASSINFKVKFDTPIFRTFPSSIN